MKEIQISLALTEQEAEDLAQFVKRVGFTEVRTNARDDDEAYRMQHTLNKVREALADVGYAPR